METRKINRINDYFFKSLMGNEKRSALTLRFLNLILNRTGNDEFKTVQFLNSENDPLTQDKKLSILDIKASVDDISFVDIEVQVARQNYMAKRSMYYLSRMYSEQMVKNQNYDELKPVIGINLLDFNLFKPKEIPAWHNFANFTLHGTSKIISDSISLHFLELPKLKYSDIKKVKRLEAWGAYFSGCSESELEVLSMNEPLLKDALSYEHAFANNNGEYIKYRQREDAIREETTKMLMAEKRGIKQGIRQGIRQGMEQGRLNAAKQIVINGLNKGYDLHIISDITGLSISDIEKIQKEYNK